MKIDIIYKAFQFRFCNTFSFNPDSPRGGMYLLSPYLFSNIII